MEVAEIDGIDVKKKWPIRFGRLFGRKKLMMMEPQNGVIKMCGPKVHALFSWTAQYIARKAKSGEDRSEAEEDKTIV